MPVITGTEGPDTLVGTANDDLIEGLGSFDNLKGGSGNDVLRGGAGGDSLDGGSGDDHVEGGDGTDFLTDNEGGDDWLDGGADGDYITIRRAYRATPEHIRIDGGGGDDQIIYSNYAQNAASTTLIDAGEGNDLIRLEVVTKGMELTLGLGQDTIVVTRIDLPMGTFVITDFAPGAGGDRIEWLEPLGHTLSGWDQSLNPFSTGHLTFRQDGADAVLVLDSDAAGPTAPVDYIVFENLQASSLTLENLDGYPVNGSIPAGLVLAGTGGADQLTGNGGHDTLEGGAGDDVLRGRGGDDTLEGGDGQDNLEGGPGDDTLAGGNDDDGLADISGGNDTLDGGGGDDYLYIYRLNHSLNETVAMFGGDGNDGFTDWSYASGTVTIDGGAGDDQISLVTSDHSHVITLGTGRDAINLNPFQPYDAGETSRTVTDFETGAAGDSVLLEDFLTSYASWDPATNPFSAGKLRLVQEGADTILQVNGLYGSPGWVDLVVFEGRDTGDFTAENFGGLSPDGTPPAGLTLTGTENDDTLTGGFGADTIEGLAGDDTLSGGAGNDTISGGDGGDILRGGSGSDVIEGGEGNDFISLQHEGGSDTISGGAGGDFILVYRNNHGVVENVSIAAGADNDLVAYQNFNLGSVTIDLGDGADTVELWGNRGSTVVTLGAGADLVEFETHYASLLGEFAITLTDYVPGQDSLHWGSYFARELTNWDQQSNPFATGHLLLSDNAGSAQLHIDRDGSGATYAPTLFMTFENVDLDALTRADFDGLAPDGSDLDRLLTGTDGPDILQGGGGNDTLLGLAGNDVLIGESGIDTLTGGLGDDVYFVDAAGDTVTENAGEGSDRVVASASHALGASASVETLETTSYTGTGAIDLTGSDIANTIFGNNGVNALSGAGGADTLHGFAGNDYLVGGTGLDNMYGGAGDDRYYIGSADGDRVWEVAGEGYDTVSTEVDYELPDTAHVERLEAGTLTATSALYLGGNNYDQTIVGNNGNNVLNGGGGDDTLVGVGGDDTLIGSPGNDTMHGGTGNDVYFVDALGDQVFELAGEGTDRVATAISYTLAVNASIETFETVQLSGTAALNLTGSTANQFIIGNNGNNMLQGGGGNDWMIGAGGNDTFVGNSSAGLLEGGTGNDVYFIVDASDVIVERPGEGADRAAVNTSYTLAADAEVETLETFSVSGQTNFNLIGNAFAQTIIGNDGANLLDGKGGNDVLIGLGADDRFTFSTALGANNVDRIEGFQSGADKIALDDAILADLNPGSMDPNRFVTGSGAQDADDRIIYDPATGALWFDADGNGAGAAVQIATLAGAPALTASDFVVI